MRQTKAKIVAAAGGLFYEQGYQATTIDQVIERSGVSRPTVYSHFSTKEGLCLEYLKERRKNDIASLKEAVRKTPGEKERFLAVIKFVGKTLIATGYRGCGFFNMISEISDCNNPIVIEARRYVDSFRDVIKDAVLELKAADPKYKKLDVDGIADAYYLIVGGAIMASQEYRDPWPIERAVKEVERLLKT